MKQKLILSMGSNIEPKKEYLKKAIELLKKKYNFKKMSSLYRTEPVEDNEQEDFFNICVIFETGDDPQKIFDNIKQIETEVGRKRDLNRPKGPRVIDIDILFFNDVQMDTDDLTIPHRSMFDRKFVLVPLFEILDKNADYIDKYGLADRLKLVDDQKVYNIGEL